MARWADPESHPNIANHPNRKVGRPARTGDPDTQHYSYNQFQRRLVAETQEKERRGGFNTDPSTAWDDAREEHQAWKRERRNRGL